MSQNICIVRLVFVTSLFPQLTAIKLGLPRTSSRRENQFDLAILFCFLLKVVQEDQCDFMPLGMPFYLVNNAHALQTRY